jgi:uncharacterized protein YndB with AHSA1/START domain
MLTMRHLENIVHFDAPIERVFDLAIDPGTWTEYMPWISDVTDVLGRGDRVGDVASFTDHAPGRSLKATTVVTEVERPTLQTTETHYEDGSHMVMTMRFAGVDGGTDIATTADYQLAKSLLSGVQEVVTGPFIERRMREMAENFARLLEPARV